MVCWDIAVIWRDIMYIAETMDIWQKRSLLFHSYLYCWTTVDVGPCQHKDCPLQNNWLKRPAERRTHVQLPWTAMTKKSNELLESICCNAEITTFVFIFKQTLLPLENICQGAFCSLYMTWRTLLPQVQSRELWCLFFFLQACYLLLCECLQSQRGGPGSDSSSCGVLRQECGPTSPEDQLPALGSWLPGR